MIFVSTISSSAHIIIFLEKKVAVTHIIPYFFTKKTEKKRKKRLKSLFKKLRKSTFTFFKSILERKSTLFIWNKKVKCNFDYFPKENDTSNKEV